MMAPDDSHGRDGIMMPSTISPKRVRKGISKTCRPYKAATVFPTEGARFLLSSFSSPPPGSLENPGHTSFYPPTCQQRGATAVPTVPGRARIRPSETCRALVFQAKMRFLPCTRFRKVTADRNGRGYQQTNPRRAIRLTDASLGSAERRLGQGRPAPSFKSGAFAQTPYRMTGQRR